MSSHDLSVAPLSSALSSYQIDLVVSGSIGAVESVRFARALRRLGARVFPTLTQGGAQFVTETALAWSCAEKVTSAFSGEASHIGFRDALVVAPASANFISKAALGICDSPALALFASYLGQKKPVIIVPNMHDSLALNPMAQKHLQTLREYVTVLGSREEEGKQKFPDPTLLADHVAHTVNQKQWNGKRVVVSLGTTRGYVDDVRYFSNYSSGKLGTEIAEELYRQGLHTRAVVGPCPIQPRSVDELVAVETNEEMKRALSEEPADAAVLAASVLDFVPSERTNGKISSQSELKVSFRPTEKIIASISPRGGIKVGFKLEAEITAERAQQIADDYGKKYSLSFMVINRLTDVSASDHKALVFERQQDSMILLHEIQGKRALAQRIAAHITSGLR